MHLFHLIVFIFVSIISLIISYFLFQLYLLLTIINIGTFIKLYHDDTDMDIINKNRT